MLVLPIKIILSLSGKKYNLFQNYFLFRLFFIVIFLDIVKSYSFVFVANAIQIPYPPHNLKQFENPCQIR